jgi:hypothetical protein
MLPHWLPVRRKRARLGRSGRRGSHIGPALGRCRQGQREADWRRGRGWVELASAVGSKMHEVAGAQRVSTVFVAISTAGAEQALAATQAMHCQTANLMELVATFKDRAGKRALKPIAEPACVDAPLHAAEEIALAA